MGVSKKHTKTPRHLTYVHMHDVYLGGRAKGEELPESGREVLEKKLLVVLVPDERGRRDGM